MTGKEKKLLSSTWSYLKQELLMGDNDSIKAMTLSQQEYDYCVESEHSHKFNSKPHKKD